jgi:hypothetical protein
MNSVDNVLFVYRFERCEREAFQMVLSLLNNPRTKVTIVMPSRQAWERELMRQYEGFDDDDYDDEDYDDDEGFDDEAATEMDELMELAVSEDDVEPEDELEKKEDDNEKDEEKIEDDEVTQSEEERNKEKKKREKCCPYSVGDFFDILFLLGLLKRGLVRLARALIQPCRGRSARERSPLDEPASASSADDIEMTPSTTKKTTKKRRATAPKPESDSETDVQSATAGRRMSTSRSVQGISRYTHAPHRTHRTRTRTRLHELKGH